MINSSTGGKAFFYWPVSNADSNGTFKQTIDVTSNATDIDNSSVKLDVAFEVIEYYNASSGTLSIECLDEFDVPIGSAYDLVSSNDGDYVETWQSKTGSIANLPVGTRTIRVSLIADIVNSMTIGSDYVGFDSIVLRLTKLDVTSPTITSVSVPANGQYVAGQNLDFTVNFDEAVNVVGAPYIPITLDTGGTVQATYVSGTGTTDLVFRYTVQSGNQDTDGIVVGALTLPGGATLKDSAGNDANLTLNSVGATTGVLVDAIAPTVTDAKISISGASGTGGAYRIGDIITATWNNTAGGDNNSEIISGVTIDFSQFGGGVAVGAFNTGGTWSATYSIAAGGIDAVNKNISVMATDDAGNTTTTADTTNATVDTIAPTVTNGNISISGASGIGGAYKIGDTVSATWNNTAGGDNNSDSIVGVTIDLSAFGGSAAVPATNSGSIWTATYTIVAGAIDGTNKNVSVTATDDAGNTRTTADTSNATVDNNALTVTDANISIGGQSGFNSTFIIGDTVQAVWDNTITGDNNSDTITGVTVNFTAFGGGAAVAATNIGGIWIAEYTIAAGALEATNRNISITVTDNAGNTTTTADTTNATIDNTAPTSPSTPDLSSASDSGTSSTDNITKSTSLTFNGTAVPDATVYLYSSIDGVLTATTAVGGNWSIPVTGLSGGEHIFTAKISDSSGNLSAPSAGLSVTIDTVAPNVVFTEDESDNKVKAGDFVAFTADFSEIMANMITISISNSSVINTAMTTADNDTWTYNWTVPIGNATAVATVAGSDIAGNSYSGVESLSFTIDNTPPTIDNANALTGYSATTHILTVKITEAVDIAQGSGSSAVDVSKITVHKVSESKTLTIGQSSAVITNISTLTITIGGTDLAAIQAFAGGEGIDAVDFAAEGVTDLVGNSNINDTGNLVVTDFAPTLQSASRTNNTQIIVRLSESCNITPANNNGGFTVQEIGNPGISYTVTSVAQGESSLYIVLNVNDFGASAMEGIKVLYTQGGNGVLEDLNGNLMVTDNTGVSITGWDFTSPMIMSGTLSSDNAYVDITFDDGVFGATDGITALTASKFSITLTQNGSPATAVISSVRKTNSPVEGSALPLTGGESTIRVFLTISGTPKGVETIEIKPANGTSIYDKAGNSAWPIQTTGLLTLNDKTAPTVTTLSPSDNAIDVSKNTNLTMTFNKNITIGTGNITLKQTSDDSVIETIDVTSGIVTGSGTNTIMINPAVSLDALTEYYVLVDATAFDDSFGNSFVGIASTTTWSFTTAALSTNANLSALTLSSGTLSPVFDSATLNYTANVSNNVSSLNITPTTADSTASIQVNGAAVLSGQAVSINLTTGLNTITVQVTAEDDTTTKAYIIGVTRASSSGSSGSSGSTPIPITPPPTPGEILVNDTIVQGGESVTVKDEEGKTTTTVIVNDNAIDEKLKQEGQGSTVIIPVGNQSDVVVGQLNGQTVKNMEGYEAVLEIKTNQVTYTLPAGEINIDAISEQIGAGVMLKDIQVHVQISNASQETAKVVADTANKNSYQIVVKPVDFEITCTNGGKTVEVSKFNGYVERTVAIPEGIDPSKITTGIVLNNDGTFSHVPTTIIVIGGKYYAKINSLTNSTYSVIYSPKTFVDMKGHWALEDVTDMGSRLIVSGTSDNLFKPNTDITRAEFAAIVVRGLGLMQSNTGQIAFNDVNQTDWFYDAIRVAYDYGIVTGFNDGNFKPNSKITRQEAMVMIARAMEVTKKLDLTISSEEVNKLLSPFTDHNTLSSWAEKSAAICIDNAIITGDGQMLTATDNITRAETAAIVRRMLKKANLI